MTPEVAPPAIIRRPPLHWLQFMPWRWGRWGWRAFAVLTLIWLIFHVVSYPVVFVWLNNSDLEPPLLCEALWTYYDPLDYCTENSDACFSLFVWELRWIAGSPTLSWILPEPCLPSDIYPWVPNADGSSVVAPDEPVK
jgi:hypothetical protein